MNMNIPEELQNHWLWQDKPFAKGQAWIDIMLLASNVRTYYRGKVFAHPRGQFITSENILSKRWGWSRTKVRAFLQTLTQSTMLSIATTGGKTTLTVSFIAVKEEDNTANTPKEIQVKKQEKEHSKSSNIEKDKAKITRDKKPVIKQDESRENNQQKAAQAPQYVQLRLIDAIEEKANEKPDEI